jgi:ABC-type transport system involved in multi-copper enzyme maturation permease subunit
MTRIAAMASSVGRAVRPDWLTGPIFTKELRVSSRRRRYYLLRFAYVALLTLFVAGVWSAVVQDEVGGGYEIARMSEVGKHIISTVVWFQFVAAQLVSVVLMSSSISDEVYRRTMPVLLTTPITSYQIVGGKLLSRLLQLVLLVAISLPLLGVVRVFGGVPWNFVIAGFFVTLTASVFAGLVAMFYSAIFRRPHTTILLSLATAFVLYALVPNIAGLLAMFLAPLLGQSSMALISLWPNPLHAMWILTMQLYEPGGLQFGMDYLWIGHCVVMVGMCGLMVFLCALLVRKVARRRAFGDPIRTRSVRRLPVSATPPPAPIATWRPRADAAPKAHRAAHEARAPATHPAEPVASAATVEGTPPPAPPDVPAPPPPPAPPKAARKAPRPAVEEIREIRGSPLLWRELRQPLLRSMAARVVVIAVGVPLALLVYVPLAIFGAFDEGGVHGTLTFIYVLIAVAGSTMLASTNVTSEKEARTLTVLLTSPLRDSQILCAKALGILRRSLPLWIPLAAHLLLFTLLRFLHPVVLLHGVALAVGTALLLAATGLFFGCCCRKTITAVMWNLSFVATLWIVLPMALQLAAPASGSDVVRGLADMQFVTIPPMQAAIFADGACLGEGGYDWPARVGVGRGGAEATAVVLSTTLLYALAAVVLGMLAARNLRRRAL